MQKRALAIPQLFFIIATRAALAAGVALLVSTKVSLERRRAIGIALVSLGGITTIPALMIVRRNSVPQLA